MHDDGYIDGRSQIKVHTDERIQIRVSTLESTCASLPSGFNAQRLYLIDLVL